MEYQMFLDCVVEQVGRLMDEESVVHTHKIRKNNGVLLDCLTIQSGSSKLSPAIYVNEYYKQYQNGRSLADIADEIYQTFLQYSRRKEPDISRFLDVSFLKERIAYKLINFQKNEELLLEVPYRKFLDLAMVYYVLVDCEECENASFLIHNEHLKLWDMTEEVLYSCAEENMKVCLPPVIRKLEDILRQVVSDGEFHDVFPMYVLSNKRNYMGAACICYANVLREFSKKIGSDLYIIPSSIHEVILIPKSEQLDVWEMEQTIQEVNDTQLMLEEVLSEHLYVYDYEKDCVACESFCG